MSITAEGENIRKKPVDGEKMINYKNLVFRTDNPIINNYDFYKRFGTLHDFLIDLLNERIDIIKASQEQSEIIKE